MTHDGDWAPHSTRERIFGNATASRDGRATLLAALLAVSVFLLVLALSTKQVTSPAPAQRLISAGIAVTTDIDGVLAEDDAALKQLAQDSNTQAIAIPGYPLEVYLNRDEILNLSEPQLRDLVLARSAAQVYAQGLGAFDRTGHQSIGRFSSQGMLELAVGQLSQGTHDRASLGTLLFALMTALVACGVLASYAGWTRVRVLGIATVVGALPGAMLFALIRFGVGNIGGGDAFVQDLREIAGTVIDVPLRNFVIVTALGVLLTVASVVFGRIAGSEADHEDVYEDDFDDYPGEASA